MNRSLVWLSLAAALALCIHRPAEAAVGDVSTQPGATLLLPYFEVDLAKSNGIDTVFSVNNASATAILGHVTLWTDMGVPVLNFNIYLTGYDVQQISLREVLKGNLPLTASAGQDPQDTRSPKGIFSQDINFASCTQPASPTPPDIFRLPPPALPSATVTGLKNALTGKASTLTNNECAGSPSTLARGFVTVDTVNNCTGRLPDDVNYFPNDVTFQNVMFGDYVYLDAAKSTSHAEPMVHIEASTTDPATTGGAYTFYGRLLGFNSADHREPLATEFAARYYNKGDKQFKDGTSLIVWRDPKQAPASFACGSGPSWFPLDQEAAVAFDDQEHPDTLSGNLFPAMAQRVDVSTLAVPFGRGWFFFDLNLSSEDSQAWVATVHQGRSSDGRFSVGTRATPLDSATDPKHSFPQ
jgi:hypothetical protein